MGKNGAAVPAADGECLAVAHALGADLQQELPVVAVLLDDAVGVAGDPDVVLVVGEAAVQAFRHHLRAAARREERGVAPARHDVAGGVVGHDRRRRHAGLLLEGMELAERALLPAAVEREDVVVRVDAGAADFARGPAMVVAVLVLEQRERLGPVGVHLEARRGHGLLRREPQRRDHQD